MKLGVRQLHEKDKLMVLAQECDNSSALAILWILQQNSFFFFQGNVLGCHLQNVTIFFSKIKVAILRDGNDESFCAKSQ